jgi:hypothetical protein
MTMIYQRDLTAVDHDAITRTQALTHGIDQLRRAASAVLAAGSGEADGLRHAVLHDAHRRIESMVRELQALT